METITIENGFIKYTICENEVTIDNIKVYEQRKGTGRKLVSISLGFELDKDDYDGKLLVW